MGPVKMESLILLAFDVQIAYATERMCANHGRLHAGLVVLAFPVQKIGLVGLMAASKTQIRVFCALMAHTPQQVAFWY